MPWLGASGCDDLLAGCGPPATTPASGQKCTAGLGGRAWAQVARLPSSPGRLVLVPIQRQPAPTGGPNTPVREAAEPSASRRGGQLGEHRGLPLERLLVAVEGIAVGQLAGVDVADMRPLGVLPDQHA
jgi:hypothetical protein